MLTISGKKDETKLRLLADRQRYKVGEEASVNLHSRDRAGTALLTWEADRILSYKIVTLREGDNTVAWAIDGPQFPNFTLTSTRMWRNECDQARLDIQVERDLRVTVGADKARCWPGRGGRARGHHGRPARPPGRGRAIHRDGRSITVAALPRPATGDRAVLLQPNPHRRLRDGDDQHISVCARDGPCLAGRGR